MKKTYTEEFKKTIVELYENGKIENAINYKTYTIPEIIYGSVEEKNLFNNILKLRAM